MTESIVTFRHPEDVDWSPAFRRARDAGTRILCLPAGDFIISEPIVPGDMSIMGEFVPLLSEPRTRIICGPQQDGIVVHSRESAALDNSVATTHGFSLSYVHVAGVRAADQVGQVGLRAFVSPRIIGCRFDQFGLAGVHLMGSSRPIGNGSGFGSVKGNCNQWNIIGSVFNRCGRYPGTAPLRSTDTNPAGFNPYGAGILVEGADGGAGVAQYNRFILVEGWAILDMSNVGSSWHNNLIEDCRLYPSPDRAQVWDNMEAQGGYHPAQYGFWTPPPEEVKAEGYAYGAVMFGNRSASQLVTHLYVEQGGPKGPIVYSEANLTSVGGMSYEPRGGGASGYRAGTFSGRHTFVGKGSDLHDNSVSLGGDGNVLLSLSARGTGPSSERDDLRLVYNAWTEGDSRQVDAEGNPIRHHPYAGLYMLTLGGGHAKSGVKITGNNARSNGDRGGTILPQGRLLLDKGHLIGPKPYRMVIWTTWANIENRRADVQEALQYGGSIMYVTDAKPGDPIGYVFDGYAEDGEAILYGFGRLDAEPVLV